MYNYRRRPISEHQLVLRRCSSAPIAYLRRSSRCLADLTSPSCTITTKVPLIKIPALMTSVASGHDCLLPFAPATSMTARSHSLFPRKATRQVAVGQSRAYPACLHFHEPRQCTAQNSSQIWKPPLSISCLRPQLQKLMRSNFRRVSESHIHSVAECGDLTRA